MTKPVFRSSPGGDDPYVGRMICGKYRIIDTIASGGMGTIYRAVQLPLDRPVAVKILHRGYTQSTDEVTFRKRFLLEASILSRLSHPNIVTVYDYGRVDDDPEDDAYYMAMELLRGETLGRRLKTRGFVPPVEALTIARQIARGVRDAHRHGVIHRDLKPPNVMLVPLSSGGPSESGDEGEEIVKVLDFGLVKVLSDDAEELTSDGTFLGSPRYMAPEQISSGPVDARTDIYSLGVILYQMLCGKVPFEGDNNVQILMSHLNDPVPAMRQRAPDVAVPEVLETFVRRLLEKKPDARPKTMDELLREVRGCEETLGLAEASVPSGSLSGATLKLPADRSAPQPPAVRDDATGATGAFPELQALAAREDASGSGASGSTLSSTVQPEPPRPAPASSAAPTRLVVGGALVLLLAGLISLYVVPRPAVVSGALSATGSAPSLPRPPRTVSVSVQSTPAGATVTDGDVVLGTTPALLSFDADALARAPRRLTLTLSGYAPYTFSQGPVSGTEAAVISATLVAETSSKKEPAALGKRSPGSPRTAGAPATGKPPPGPEGDIRMTR